MPIHDYITQLTCITDEMVVGQKIDGNGVENYLKDVDLIIAHIAQFDRTFFEKAFPDIEPKAWCYIKRSLTHPIYYASTGNC